MSGSSAVQSMELGEMNQRLSFLDVERRKDRELIATLLERLETQTGKLEVQTRQIQELEGLLANTRAELVKFTTIEGSMEQLRRELVLLVKTNEEKRDKAYRELSRLRQVEQEAITRQISELRKEQEPIHRYEEEIEGLRAENGRVHGTITKLQHQLADLDKRSEDRIQSVIYLEEQRRQDNRRIANLEAENTALRKQTDDLLDKVSLVEQGIQAKNKEIDKAADLLEQQTQTIENQRVSGFRWERQVAEWAKLVERMEKDTAGMSTQAVRLQEQHDMVRRALADLDPFRERIERRQTELSEMQRLTEDRQKRIMEEWQAEREKERKHFNVENEERWRENARLNEKRDTRIKALEGFANEIVSQIQALWNVNEAWAQSIMIGPREWMATWEDFVKGRPLMPVAPKSAPPSPSQMPNIRPLPSAHAAEKEK